MGIFSWAVGQIGMIGRKSEQAKLQGIGLDKSFQIIPEGCSIVAQDASPG